MALCIVTNMSCVLLLMLNSFKLLFLKFYNRLIARVKKTAFYKKIDKKLKEKKILKEKEFMLKKVRESLKKLVEE